MTKTTLYHVSPSRNDSSIEELGVDPSFSLGEQKRCWFVNYRQLEWAIIHVAQRHKVSVDEISVWYCQVDWEEIKLTRWKGRFTCDVIVDAQHRISVSDVLAMISNYDER